MPTRSKIGVLAAAVALCVTLQAASTGPMDATGEVGLGLMLRKLATVGTVMHATAHPDDENNGLLAMQSHGKGFRVVLATATRGNGGQNEIGPEIFEALGVLRTEELLAAHRFDGAEQFFARAVDFGYSFSIEESYEKWGKQEIVGDYVRLMRMTRPDVVLTMRPDGTGGGQHHQASARIATEAFRLAGDPTKYPEQIREGLRPWQPRKIYQTARYGFSNEPAPEGAKLVSVDTNVYDPLLGRTYMEIGAEGRSMHKCQGMGQLLPLPGSFETAYRLVDTVLPGGTGRDESSLTDGLDLSLTGLARFAGDAPPMQLTAELTGIAASVEEAGRALRQSGPEATLPALTSGLTRTRALRTSIASGSLGLDEQAAYEIDFRLEQTAHEFERAIVLAHALRVDVLADDGVVVPGQKDHVSIVLANRASKDDQLRIDKVQLEGFSQPATSCAAGPVHPGAIVKCEADVAVPQDARITEPYWHRAGEAGRYTFDDDAPFGLPFRPTPFVAVFDLSFGGTPVTLRAPVVYRYGGNIFSGEKRTNLLVVPAVTLRVDPAILIVPANGSTGAPTAERKPAITHVSTAAVQPAPHATPAEARTIQVAVTNNTPGPLETSVALAVPDGWSVAPATRQIRFEQGDEADTVTFRVTPPAGARPGTFALRASAGPSGEFTRGYEVIEYPHIHRRHVFDDAVTTAKVIDVKVPAGLTVGYVMGVGDQVPPALEQLGVDVVQLNEAALASGDLSRFDAIITGVRAYERRKDLRVYNHRLIEYAKGGGTVIVQYNKYEFNRAQYGPYPAKVSSNRVTDEHAPVTVLVPSHPVFNKPNVITAAAWEGWVQERGLYFLGERDDRYVDLVELEDPFELNKGIKRGALVEGDIGKGRWIYVGLGLWRQLPAGTDGAYQLLANLVSLGKTAGPAASGDAK
jgi:LmbE family N-acetylglucosaminyl deacetylase